MPVITVFNASFCDEADVVWLVRSATGLSLITDADIVAEAARMSDIPEAKISLAFSAKTSVFHRPGRERERAIIHLRLALATLLGKNDLLIAGFSGLLIPKQVTHVLRVCLVAEIKFRIAAAVRTERISEKEAVRRITKDDEDRTAWTQALFEKPAPWDESLYDIVIPMDKTSLPEAVDLISENAAKKVVQPTEQSLEAVEDFRLEATVAKALSSEGHFVDVAVRGGAVTLTINKHVLRLKRLEEELTSIVGSLPGVKSVETKIGKGYHRSNIYRRHDFSLPDQVLLVDDEREFVQSLSDRLLMCDIDTAVTYDGESALDLLNGEEPEVMILDLRMPGIDGFEVLRRVKETRPEVEVVILTAHGTAAERQKCMEMGAFAFLQKPVDINVLSETLKKAKEKIRQNIAEKRRRLEC